MDVLIGPKTITRGIFSCSTLLALATTANLVREQDLTFVPSRISDGEVWRAVTGLLYLGKMDVEFASVLLMYPSALHWHEVSFYHTTRAFVWRLVVLSVLALLASVYLRLRYPGLVVLVALAYLSGRRNVNERLGFLVIVLPSGLFPFHNIAMAYVIGKIWMMKTYIAGGLLGHLVLLLDDIYPVILGRSLLALPNERPAEHF